MTAPLCPFCGLEGRDAMIIDPTSEGDLPRAVGGVQYDCGTTSFTQSRTCLAFENRHTDLLAEVKQRRESMDQWWEDHKRITDGLRADLNQALDAIDTVMSLDKGMFEEEWVPWCNEQLPLMKRHGRQKYTAGWS